MQLNLRYLTGSPQTTHLLQSQSQGTISLEAKELQPLLLTETPDLVLSLKAGNSESEWF